jgi:hypothetical protein
MPGILDTGSAAMSDHNKVNRRDFIATTTAVAGAASTLAGPC